MRTTNYHGMNMVEMAINNDIERVTKIKKHIGNSVFSLEQIRDYTGIYTNLSLWVIRRTLFSNVTKLATIAYFEKISHGIYRLLESPVLHKQSVLEIASSVSKCREIFAKHGINLIIPTENNKENLMTKPKPIEREAKIDESLEVATVMFNAGMSGKSPLVAEFEYNFKKATNAERAEIACLLNPFLSKAETLIKFNQLYPVYAMPSVKKGDMVFHPIAGKKEVVEADEKWIYFYGNGSKWKCDRNGYIDGLRDKPRSVWESFESYAKDMNK